MDETPYLARGIEILGTDSSVLISSSKYLNEPRLREWVAKVALKKNAGDFPPTAEMYELIQILEGLRDYDRIELLFTEERKNNPALDAWFNQWFCSDYTFEDLKDCAPGTLGGLYYEAAAGEYEVQIVPNFKPHSQWQYYSLRAGQTHDYEHILTGGGFNYIGELLPYWFRLATIDTYIQNKELAGEMNVMGILGTMRYLVRTVLHYPETWGAALKCIEQGIAIGRNSDPFWMAKMEEYWNTPLDEARKQLGVRGAVDLDTVAAGEIWSGLKTK